MKGGKEWGLKTSIFTNLNEIGGLGGSNSRKNAEFTYRMQAFKAEKSQIVTFTGCGDGF